MKKKRVMSFALALGVFALILTMLHALMPSSLTGSVIAEYTASPTSSLATEAVSVSIVSYERYKDALQVRYAITNKQDAPITYTSTGKLIAQDESWLVEGTQELVVAAHTQQEFEMFLELPAQKTPLAQLLVQVTDGSSTASVKKTISTHSAFASLTAFATGTLSKKTNVRMLLAAILIGIILTLIIAKVHRNYRRKKSAVYNSHFIELKL